MHLPHITTLEEAATYLSAETMEAWLPKSVLDFVLFHTPQRNGIPKPVAYAAMPLDVNFGRYSFSSPGGMVRKGAGRWQLVPLYPIHAAQLIAVGSTFAGKVESPDDSYGDGEHYTFIEPLESKHEITFDMVRLKRADVESIARQYGSIHGGNESKPAAPETPAASSGAPECDEQPAPVSDEYVPRPNLFALPGVKTTDIIEAFGLVGKKWLDIRKTDRYWKAIHTPGGRGKGMHTWKPADFAICLLKTGERKNKGALRAIITGSWPDWLPEFESQLEEIGKK